MHADDFRLDRYGVVSGLRDGGYSDDMTLAAISGIFSLTFSVQSRSFNRHRCIDLSELRPSPKYSIVYSDQAFC